MCWQMLKLSAKLLPAAATPTMVKIVGKGFADSCVVAEYAFCQHNRVLAKVDHGVVQL